MTTRVSLDGLWDFLHTTHGASSARLDVRKIAVPAPWQARFPDLRMKAGIGIYKREVEIPSGWRDGHVFLRFGAVFHHCRVWVNDVPVGEHEGGFLPFSFDVTEHLVEGRNTIKVRAESPTDNPLAYPEAPLAEIPFGKQSWYGPLSGIWQPVHLEWRHVDHIERARLLPDPATGNVKAFVFFHQPLSQDADLEIVAIDPAGDPCARVRLAAPAGSEEMSARLTIPSARFWSPDEPNLYSLQISLRNRRFSDEICQTFGFRTFEARDGKFHLNGKPFYLRGALDQDYYPDTICTVPSVEFLEDQFRKAKELGLNCLRCHIKAADPRYYDVADRMGMLIWTELPNGGLSTERSRARKEALLKGIVDRDSHHPSIVIWTIINENWGVDLVHDAEHRAWLKRTYHWLKGYDPTRLVVDNSPLDPSFHVQTDIADYHFYAAIPDNRQAWDKFTDELAARADWLYSPAGDAAIGGREPLVCSEFGNWGLPNPRDLEDAAGHEPWWFETGHDWGEGVMYAHGMENRFSDWSLDRIFGSLEEFIEAAQWQQFRALKYEIEGIRRKPELAGYVITELTDVHWESNGLLDMRRNRRVFHEKFPSINADTVIVARPARYAYWSGERLRVELTVACGAGPAIEDARLEVAFGGSRVVLEVPRVEPTGVAGLGTIALDAPEVSRAVQMPLELRLLSPSGAMLAANVIDVAVHPRRQAKIAAFGEVWSPAADLRDHLAELGVPMAASTSEAGLVVARSADAGLAGYVRDGGRLLLLPDAEGSLYPFFPHWQKVCVAARAGTLWQGDWASSFSWLDRSGVFADLPGGPMLDFSFDRVIPRHVITGCNLLDFQSRVHGGLAVGWIHRPAALAVERAYGKGRIVASTMRLFEDAPGADPTAFTLLQGLFELAQMATGQRRLDAVSRLHARSLRAG
jgi:hypothetical protein